MYSFYNLSWIHNLFPGQHSEFSTQDEIPIFLISISYLIFDLILIVLATLIILDPLKVGFNINSLDIFIYPNSSYSRHHV
jgi:hypothetical protein